MKYPDLAQDNLEHDIPAAIIAQDAMMAAWLLKQPGQKGFVV